MLVKGLLLKGGAGLATAAAGGAGIYYGLDHFKNQSTKFDQGLIDHLENEGKIKFAVLSGSDGTTALTSFPTLTSDQTVVATVKVSTSGTNESTEGKIEEKSGAADGAVGTKKYLKRINGDSKGEGTDWIWTCEIQFKKEEGTTGANDLKDSDQLFKSSNGEGFLNKLKKEGEKDLKIKFIQDCAKARGKDKNRKINDLISLVAGNEAIAEANKIKSTKEFTLRKGDKTKDSTEENEKLYPVKKWEFNDWFSIK